MTPDKQQQAIARLLRDMAGNELCWDANEAVLLRVRDKLIAAELCELPHLVSTQPSSPGNALADRLYQYICKYRDDWPTPGPALKWADLNMIIEALRRPAQGEPSRDVIIEIIASRFATDHRDLKLVAQAADDILASCRKEAP